MAGDPRFFVLAGATLTTGASSSRRSLIGTNSTGNKVTVDGTVGDVETVQVTVTGAPLTDPKFFVRVQAASAP